MCTSRDINRQALLNCSDNDENGGTKEFYERNLPYLMLHPMSSIPSHVLRNIAVMLHSTLLFDSDWRDYATKMGVTDNLLLAKIQASAKACHEQELYITLKAVLPHKMLGHIITTLLNSQRYDVLRVIQPDVTKLLESNSSTEVKEVTSCHIQSSEFKAKELTHTTNSPKESNSETISFENSLTCTKTNQLTTIASNSGLLDGHSKQEFNTLQQSSIHKDLDGHAKQEFNTLQQSSIRKDYNFPSAPSEDRLSVFIQHSEFDSHIARELSVMLREGGIVVTTLSDMDNVIAMDPTGGALSTIFQEVDFIVPIVSEKFLQQIHPKVYENYLESTDAMNNRCLYQLIMNEYRNNRCVNFRVRPVIVPQMNRRLLINDVILSFSFRLWSEVPKLISILKGTKELIPQYALINSMKNS